MKMVLVYWINPTKETLDIKIYRHIPLHYEVGYENGYGHYILSIFVKHGNKFISCNSFLDYVIKTKDNPKIKNNILNTFIDKIINLLTKLKRY